MQCTSEFSYHCNEKPDSKKFKRERTYYTPQFNTREGVALGQIPVFSTRSLYQGLITSPDLEADVRPIWASCNS